MIGISALPRENCMIGMATLLPCMPNISALKWNLTQRLVGSCCVCGKTPDPFEHEPLSEQHKLIPGSMETSDETLHREAGNDMTKV